MNRKTLIFIIVAIAGVCCLCTAIIGYVMVSRATTLVGQTVSMDPQKTGQVAKSITDYKLPANYKEAFSMSLLGVSMAGFSSTDDATMIMFFQFPQNSGLSQQQMEEQMRQMWSQQNRENYNINKVGTIPTTIRGKPVELSVYEGTSSNGKKVRQLIGLFEGKNGTALLMVAGDIDQWDQRSIDAFIASMR
jgi:hypothetical protein